MGRALALTKLGISLGLPASQRSRRRSPQNAAERTLGSAPATLEIQSNEDVYKWRGLVMLHADITHTRTLPWTAGVRSPRDNSDSENGSEGHS